MNVKTLRQTLGDPAEKDVTMTSVARRMLRQMYTMYVAVRCGDGNVKNRGGSSS
ncbi:MULTISPECIES: hypothetical protein [Pyrobaculum]|uniref:Uncharacterized protein n=1 Tax=Pyrobaculum arsenaticum TaxID=121277 RepID=A0A7L4PE60_9CREN|nr:hypothetical protein [Pyrobaculum arsenaticum]MCY0890687.1 hypothetical protein [Pyrobaculum arsenaticum]NYR15966.1 hypothetical protein [Pyrobaculum arsenaticum]